MVRRTFIKLAIFTVGMLNHRIALAMKERLLDETQIPMAVPTHVGVSTEKRKTYLPLIER